MEPGETYNPWHHGQHYHVEYMIDPSKSWNNKNNVQKVYPPGYTKGSGPQGTIVQLEGVQGICVDGLPANIMVDTLVEWIIQGYDDKNMWCILKPAN